MTRKLSDEQLQTIRKGLIKLSEAGHKVLVFLQVGISQDGTPLIYDIGAGSLIKCINQEEAFRSNNNAWTLSVNHR